MTRLLWVQLIIAFPIIIPNECFSLLVPSDDLEISGHQLYLRSAEESLPHPGLGKKYSEIPHYLSQRLPRNKKQPSGILKTNRESSLNNVLLTPKNRQNPAKKQILELFAKYPNEALKYRQNLNSENKHVRTNKLQQILKFIEISKTSPTQDKNLAKIEKYLSLRSVASKLFGKGKSEKMIARCRSLRSSTRSDTNTVCVTYPASWGAGANYTYSGNYNPYYYYYPSYYYYPYYYYPYYYWG